ncbi:MAG: hypothetical protein DHS20C14_20270 [Phycisphaeraceae bacterium]|nr:MAG: hypothetical protein DHS20C14_20270 [Phycisphaeraceae bacterium]
MGRSTGMVFFVAFVLAAVAFVLTLLLAPMPPQTGPRQLSPAERAQLDAERGQRQQYISAQNAHYQNRTGQLIAGDWAGLAESARAMLELNPDHLWANLDLMHAMAAGEGTPEQLRRHAEGLREFIATSSPERREPGWQVYAATGWAAWFSGDEAEARDAWAGAAENLRRDRSGNGWYNRAGYLSLSSDADGAIEAWEEAVSLGYGQQENGHDQFAYARADYDNRLLREDPRFESIIARADELIAARQASDATARSRRAWDRLQAAHVLAHPPMTAGGSHGSEDGGTEPGPTDPPAGP